MNTKLLRSDCLFEWVCSLGIAVAGPNGPRRPRPADFQDGVLISRILKDVIDPIEFADLPTTPSDSQPLVSVLDKMKKYFALKAEHPVPSYLLPNGGKIMLGDLQEISRLLQLLLGCAINSPPPRNEEFIKNIQSMPSNLQEVIMEAIQELMIQEDLPDSLPVLPSLVPSDVPIRLQKALETIRNLTETNEQLSQSCHELNAALGKVREEKAELTVEVERLSIAVAQGNEPDSLAISSKLAGDLRRELDEAREENFKLEEALSDTKLKLSVLERETNELHAKVASLSAASEELTRVKDEMDILREAASKASRYEVAINSYKNKLEEMAVLKVTIKTLEEKNTELMMSNAQLSEDTKKTSTWRGQLEDLKKELTHTQQRLSQETQRALKAELDVRIFREKFETAQGKAERLLEEKNAMADAMEFDSRTHDPLHLGDVGPTDSIHLLPASIKEKIVRLEIEKRNLAEEVEALLSSEHNAGSRVLVDALRKQEAKLESDLVLKNHEIEGLKEEKRMNNEKIMRLESLVIAKEEELRKKETQYKKCMEKAKSVIVTLEPTAAAGFDQKQHAEVEKARAIREMEEKLLSSAFYNMGIQLHRNAVESRNTMLQKYRHSARRPSDL